MNQKHVQMMSVYSPAYHATHNFEYWVADDCLVVSGSGAMLCPLRSEPQARAYSAAITSLARATHMKKVVALEFYCDEGPGHSPDENEELFREDILKVVDEFLWLQDALQWEHKIREMIPSFSVPIGCYNDALDMQVWMPHFVKTAERISHIQYQIKHDIELRNEYPVVCKVQALEYHPSSWPNQKIYGQGFEYLFPDGRQNMVTAAKVVALFKKDEPCGVLVTESNTAIFSLVGESCDMHKFFDAQEKGLFARPRGGSLRIILREGSTQLSLYLEPGMWTAEPHQELVLGNSYACFRAMAERLKKVEEVQVA
jgi:hypothetical protein